MAWSYNAQELLTIVNTLMLGVTPLAMSTHVETLYGRKDWGWRIAVTGAGLSLVLATTEMAWWVAGTVGALCFGISGLLNGPRISRCLGVGSALNWTASTLLVLLGVPEQWATLGAPVFMACWSCTVLESKENMWMSVSYVGTGSGPQK